MSAAPVHVTNYLDARRHALDARRGPRARRAGRGRDGGDARRSTAPACAAPRRGAAIDVGNAGTLLRLLPGWLAGQPEGGRWTLDGDESIRRRPVDRVARPARGDGRRSSRRATDRFTPLAIDGPAAARDRVRAAGRLGADQVAACCSPGCSPTGTTTVVEPEPSRDHTERLLAARRRRHRRATATAITRHAAATSSRSTRSTSPATRPRRRSTSPPRCSSPARGSRSTGMAAQLDPRRLLPHPRAHGRGADRRRSRTRATRRAGRRAARASSRSRTARSPRTRVTADEVPLAIDELPLVALLGCFAEGETVVEGAQELRLKESDRIATVVDGLRGLGADIEATDDGFAVRGTGGLRGGTSARPRRPPARDARRGRRARQPRRASRSSAWRPPRSPIPASRADLAALTG